MSGISGDGVTLRSVTHGDAREEEDGCVEAVDSGSLSNAREADEDGLAETDDSGSLLETRDTEDNVRGLRCGVVRTAFADETLSLPFAPIGAVVDGRVLARREWSDETFLRDGEIFIGDIFAFPYGSRKGDSTFLGSIDRLAGEAEDTTLRFIGDGGTVAFRTGDLTDAVLREETASWTGFFAGTGVFVVVPLVFFYFNVSTYLTNE